MLKKIIHVDNSNFFRKLVKTTLAEFGHISENTDSGKETLDYLKNGTAEAIIMGMSLNDMTGEDLLKEILLLPNKIPVIVLTSNNDTEEKEKILKMGFTTYISKSENWQELLEKALQF